jgi:hypothetical protein
MNLKIRYISNNNQMFSKAKKPTATLYETNNRRSTVYSPHALSSSYSQNATIISTGSQ